MSGVRMNEHDEEQKRIRHYLLGRLNEDERELLEERIFTDSAFFQQVRMMEEELVEDYVFKILPPQDAEGVAQRLLSTPEQIEYWEITKGVKKYSDSVRRQDARTSGFRVLSYLQSVWALPIAATMIVVVIAGVWMMRASSLERTVAALNAPGRVAGTYSDFPLELPALRLRSGPQANTPEQRIALPKQVDVVQIRLPVEVGTYTNYQTTLIREPDSTLFTLNDRLPIDAGNRKLLAIRVPADALVPGEYRLVVKGSTDDRRFDDLGIYLFTIL